MPALACLFVQALPHNGALAQHCLQVTVLLIDKFIVFGHADVMLKSRPPFPDVAGLEGGLEALGVDSICGAACIVPHSFTDRSLSVILILDFNFN